MTSAASGTPARELVFVVEIVSPGCARRVLTTLLGSEAALRNSELKVKSQGAWCMVRGARCMVHGAWCAVQGIKGRERGAWCMKR